MRKNILVFALITFTLSTYSQKSESSNDTEKEKTLIDLTIQDWDKAWETKDLELALKHYSNNIDWTNAFGDRVQSKDELKQLLSFIFKMDFVMTGENNYGKNEITLLNDNTAKVRSINIRKNQQWADGSKMDDRRINHLRIYQKINGRWLITDHMISQAWPKDPK